MKKILFAIFAHPDDEAFGPSGTLLTEAKAGNDVHLITLTRGEAGCNPDNVSDLGTLREQEWRKAGALIGATSMRMLGYQDSQLNNETMIEAAQKVEEIVHATLSMDNATEIEFMTSDLNGISGHIDHIVAARAACLTFYRLKDSDRRCTRIRLACVPRSQLKEQNTDWLYMEAGRLDDEIDEIIDAREYKDEIISIMRCHDSQRADLKNHLDNRGDLIGLNHFMIKT